MANLTTAEHIEKITALIKDVKYAMMTTETYDKGHLHSCPMTTLKNDLTGRKIWFLSDKNSETVKDLQKNPQVNLSYTTSDEKDFVSISGKATLTDDKEKINELWNPIYNAFYEHGKEDPNIELICVECHGAEYWLSGNSVVNVIKMTAAALQDGKSAENLGENYTVDLSQ